LTWCFEDERTPATVALLDRIAEDGANAPALWPLEVLNGLAMAERRKRLTSMQRLQLSGFLQSLPIALDVDTAAQAWTATPRLAERHRLTLYDATYLELAQRLQQPLATLDAALRDAARAAGIDVLGT
jgi:predicted nucleic acid-binding protein